MFLYKNRKNVLIGLAFATMMGACAAASSVLDHVESVGENEGDINLHDLSVQDSDESVPCVEAQASKITSARPVDVIFVIDNSGSMSEEIQSITKNINDHFANVMDADALDYRVIMVVKHGSPSSYYGNACFEEPLSTIPKGGCQTLALGKEPGNKPGKFYHYSYDVQSNDSPCIILDTLFAANNHPDVYGLAPNGWIEWLRPTAFKILIEVTDDSPGCWWYPDVSDTTKKKVFNDFGSSLGGQIFALEIDKKLTNLAPEQFGTPEKRNYAFYSIVGMKEKPNAMDEEFGQLIDPLGKEDDPFYPDEEVVANNCSTAVAPGFGYQSLSKMTGGLRFPVCQAEKFDIIFEKIAKSIDSITSTICTIEIPSKGIDGDVDLSTVQLSLDGYDPDSEYLQIVSDEKSCTGAGDEYYIDTIANYVALCPESCKVIKSSGQDVLLSAGCVSIIN